MPGRYESTARDAGPAACATEQAAQIAVDAEGAWQSYWFKFSQTAPPARTPC
jgi:hypothetical protein